MCDPARIHLSAFTCSFARFHRKFAFEPGAGDRRAQLSWEEREQVMSGAPPHSSQSSLTSYDDDIDDDAWANFDLSGAIDQHQRCSSSQPTATLGRSSPTLAT